MAETERGPSGRSRFIDLRRVRGKIPKFPDFGLEYLDHLIGEYQESGKTCAIAQEIINRRNDKPNDLTWGDLYSFERTLIASLNEEEIRRTLWAIRFRLKQIAGAEAFAAYNNSGFPDDKASVEQLRADLQRLLELLHWYYSLLPLRNQMRIGYIRACLVWIMVYTIGLGGIFVLSHRLSWDSSVGLLALVIYFGIVGGFVSSLRRLQNVEFGEGDPMISIYSLKSASYFRYMSPMLGAVFALVLMLLFAAGVLTGAFFPSIGATGDAPGLSSLMKMLQPADSKNYALLLAWSFVAGFAERLVPDNLDKMIARQSDEQSGKGKTATS